MNLGRLSISYRLAVVGLLAIATVAWGSWDRAEARAARQHAQKRAVHGSDYRPPYADIVVDSNSGACIGGWPKIIGINLLR